MHFVIQLIPHISHFKYFTVMKEKMDPYYKLEHEDKVPAFVLKMRKQMVSTNFNTNTSLACFAI